MDKVLTRSIGDIFIVTLNRPTLRNAIDHETSELLVEAFSYFDKSDQYKVGILTGTQESFCSGADLKTIAESSEGAPRLHQGGSAPLGVSRMRLSKPIIAAIEGHAVAGGLELALWCDLRVAAEDAVFGVYCRRFGVPLVDGGTIRLPRLIGQSHAMDMVLTGRAVKGIEAKNMGLINRMCDPGNALTTAIDLAKQLTAFPQICMRSDRLSLLEQWSLTEAQALSNETRRGKQVLESGETLNGAQKFIKGGY